jgi:phage terminase small subunit
VALTEKQKAFVREYIVDLNATQAAIRAGYSKKSAAAIGDENLRKPAIKALVSKAMRKRAISANVRAIDVLLELARLGHSDILNIVEVHADAQVAVKPSSEWDENTARAVKSIKNRYDKDAGRWVVDIVLHDKIRPLELLQKHTAGDMPGDVTFNLVLKQPEPDGDEEE